MNENYIGCLAVVKSCPWAREKGFVGLTVKILDFQVEGKYCLVEDSITGRRCAFIASELEILKDQVIE